jgi:pimeloyl-ACP methyl ester carboxylesterase
VQNTNSSTFRSSDINGAKNHNYPSAAVRSLSSYTIRNNNDDIQLLRKNHHLPVTTTNNHPSLQKSSCLFRRHFSASSSSSSSSSETPIDTAHAGHSLLKGLDVHTVSSEMDGHPLAVYTIQQQQQNDDDDSKSSSSASNNSNNRTPVLLLHGRTWSSVPVYHLVGENNSIDHDIQEDGEECNNNFSLMEALYNTGHIQPYAMDFRGFGGTPKDDEGYVEPLKCVKDVVSVLKWIQSSSSQDADDDDDDASSSSSSSSTPALLGWSHGALIAQIVAQRHPEHLSKLILYSSIYNPNIKYSIPPPYADPMKQHNQRQSSPMSGHTDHDDFPLHEMTAPNEYDLAMADFTNYFDTFKPNNNNNTSSSSTVHRQYQPPKSAKLFANAALISDPIKVQWWNLHQLNECHPSKITTLTPTMVVVGDNDPYAPMVLQAELFTNLNRGVDRTWSIIANADHAIHLSEERGRFVQSVGSFVQNK